MLNRIKQFLCSHKGTYRECREGARFFVCPRCGYAEPQINRAVPLLFDGPAHERMKAQRTVPSGFRAPLPHDTRPSPMQQQR